MPGGAPTTRNQSLIIGLRYKYTNDGYFEILRGYSQGHLALCRPLLAKQYLAEFDLGLIGAIAFIGRRWFFSPSRKSRPNRANSPRLVQYVIELELISRRTGMIRQNAHQ